MIKKLSRILPLLMIILLCLTVVCLADDTDPMRNDLWRLNDYVEAISEERAYELDERILHIAMEKKMDLPICINDDYAGKTLAEFGAWFYDHNKFGYGADREGLLLIIDTVNNVAEAYAFGPTSGMRYPESVCGRMEKKVMEAYLADGCEDAIATYLRFIDSYITTDSVQTSGNPASQTAPLVVDKAELFTQEEERDFTEQLTQLRGKYGADFVLFTDTTTHGLRKRVYGADFYEFNGYGVGEDRSGMILFICMEEGNRGWWQGGTGACESLFTDENVERLNARLDPYMIAGDYAVGVRAFFEDVDAMFISGETPDAHRSAGRGILIMIASLTALSILVSCVLLHRRKKAGGKASEELRTAKSTLK